MVESQAENSSYYCAGRWEEMAQAGRWAMGERLPVGRTIGWLCKNNWFSYSTWKSVDSLQATHVFFISCCEGLSGPGQPTALWR